MLPNFLIIGAGRSGTTSLYHYLREHPDIYMSPVKEANFFMVTEGEKPRWGDKLIPHLPSCMEDYQALFRGVSNEKAIGEASPTYLSFPGTAERIRHCIPSSKLIAILRHPADRAYSHYLFFVRMGYERIMDFPEALQAEETRIRENWYPSWFYKQGGYYHAQLKHYFDVFPRHQIQVHLFDDLQNNKAGMLRDIYRFLDVDDSFVPNLLKKHNVGKVPKYRTLHSLLTRTYRLRTRVKPCIPSGVHQSLVASFVNLTMVSSPPLPPEVRRELAQDYREDILQLQDLIDRDLSDWLES